MTAVAAWANGSADSWSGLLDDICRAVHVSRRKRTSEKMPTNRTWVSFPPSTSCPFRYIGRAFAPEVTVTRLAGDGLFELLGESVSGKNRGPIKLASKTGHEEERILKRDLKFPRGKSVGERDLLGSRVGNGSGTEGIQSTPRCQRGVIRRWSPPR